MIIMYNNINNNHKHNPYIQTNLKYTKKKEKRQAGLREKQADETLIVRHREKERRGRHKERKRERGSRRKKEINGNRQAGTHTHTVTERHALKQNKGNAVYC